MTQVDPTIWVNPDEVAMVRENMNQYQPEARTEIVLRGGRYIYSPWRVDNVLNHLSGAVR